MVNNTKIWYHGTTDAYNFSRIMSSMSIGHLDFGKGFYLTDDRERAIKWAIRKANFRKKEYNPMLLTCRVELSQLMTLYNFKDFGSNFSEEYLKYLVFNRLDDNEYIDDFKNYDAVFGIVADGVKLNHTLDKYNKNMLKYSETINKIKYKEYQCQLCIKNQKILDSDIFKLEKKEILEV